MHARSAIQTNRPERPQWRLLPKAAQPLRVQYDTIGESVCVASVWKASLLLGASLIASVLGCAKTHAARPDRVAAAEPLPATPAPPTGARAEPPATSAPPPSAATSPAPASETLSADSAGESSKCGAAPVMRMRGGDCAAGDLLCAMAAAKAVPQPPRYRDPALAAELEACANDCKGGNAHHCFRVAESYRQGSGAKRDQTRAARFFGEACQHELVEGCDELWEMFGKDRSIDVKPAVLGYEAHCAQDFVTKECFRAAQAYEHGWGVKRNRRRARGLYAHLCEIYCRDSTPRTDCEAGNILCAGKTRLNGAT